MANIGTLSSFVSQDSAFNMAPSICQCRAIARDCGELWLPISRRGHFLRDSFFENARANFHLAIQEMLAKWKDMDKLTEEWMAKSQSLDSSFNLYRQLKSSANQEDSQASTLVSDSKTHKVVVDVQDFTDGDIKVKVLGDKEVVVEGQGSPRHVEGSSSTNRFCKRFTFPSNINMTEVTSVLSSDGVLTIEAPKLNENETTQLTRYIPVEIEGTTSASSSSSKESAAGSNANSSTDKNKKGVVYYCRDCNKKIGSWHKASETKSTLMEGVTVPEKNNTSSGTKKIIPVQQEASSERRKESQTKFITIEQEANKEKNSQEHRDIAVKTNALQAENKSKNCYDVPITSGFSIFPVSFRGPFFSDSFFRSVQNDFQSAVQEVLSRWGARTSMLMEDNLSAYRKLRLQNLKEETQAAKTTEDETNYKFVLDVQDFTNGGEVTVKALNDREIVVEGHIEMEGGGSKSLKRFLQRFSVPGNLKLDSVSSVISSDGVLTITAPKKPSSVQLKEVIVPMSIEGTEVKGTDIKKTQESQLSSKTHVSSVSDMVSGEHIIPVNIEDREALKNKTERNLECTEQKMQISQANKEHIVPVNVEGTSEHNRQQSLDDQAELKIKCHEEKLDKKVQEQTMKDLPVKNRVVPVNLEVSSNNTQAQAITHQKDCIIPVNVEGSSSHVKEHTSNNQMKVYKESNEDKDSTTKQSDKFHFAHQRAQASSTEKQTTTNSQLSGNLACTPVGSHYLSISRKGLFLDDSFFQGYQKNFQEAVKDVLIKSRRFVDNTDCMTAYRSLRQSDLKVENQALYAQEDNESFKVAVDAKDFLNGDITVRVEGEELVIEGKAEKSEAKSSDSLTFSHRFLLPDSFDVSTVSSAISSDGILTVQCPKRAGGDASADSIRRMTTEARSEHESHDEGAHTWEQKRVKQSSQKGDGFSSRTFCSSYNSQLQQSSNQ